MINYVDRVLVPTIKSRDVKIEKLIKRPKDIVINRESSLNKIKISFDKIEIEVKGEEEANQAMRYLDQLEAQYDSFLPICEFEFYSPMFGYRGFMIDTVREFFSVKELKRIIYAFSLVGYNYFHFHLTDDQGWRFAVPGYDKLETISSKRFRYENDDLNHVVSGFYTTDDLKEIEAYCLALGITVIPEIETPGHAEALLASYPEFGCTGEVIPVQANYGVFSNVMNPASPSLWVFLDKAIETLSSIFHGPFIHIGGDECPHEQWEKNQECLALMKENNITNVDDLQGLFTSKMSHLVSSYGKRAIGWDEVVDAKGVDKKVVVMSWRGLEGARKATRMGHEVILCPQTAGCYLDRYPSNDDWEKGNLSIGTPKDAFNLDISMFELPEEYRKLILGAQCNLWCEKIDSGREAEMMLFPRAFILAESMWLGEKKDWEVIKRKRKALYDLCFNLNLVCSPLRWD